MGPQISTNAGSDHFYYRHSSILYSSLMLCGYVGRLTCVISYYRCHVTYTYSFYLDNYKCFVESLDLYSHGFHILERS